MPLGRGGCQRGSAALGPQIVPQSARKPKCKNVVWRDRLGKRFQRMCGMPIPEGQVECPSCQRRAEGKGKTVGRVSA